jgi:ABC-type amino acid transport system permease subunit
MLRTVVDARGLVAMVVAMCVGIWGLHTYPVPPDNLFLGLIAARNPPVFHVLTYGYATLWFSTPFLVASMVLSVLAIVAYRYAPSVRTRPLPAYPIPEMRTAPSLVLGE